MNSLANDYNNSMTEYNTLFDYSKLRSTTPSSGTAEGKWNYESLPPLSTAGYVDCQQFFGSTIYCGGLKSEDLTLSEPDMVFLKRGRRILVLDAKSSNSNLYEINEFYSQVSPDTKSKFEQKHFLSRIIENIFHNGKYEAFEDGIQSVFSKSINRIIKTYKDEACQLIFDTLLSKTIDSDLLYQTIRCFGTLHDDETKQKRFEIIVPFLSHISSYIRDCAALALYDLELPEAIPYIRQAIKAEPYKSLKKDMEDILKSLEDFRSAKINPKA